MRPRVLALSCIAIVLAAGGALSAYWLWSADRLAERIAAWSEQQRARGYEVSYRGPVIGGYPFGLTAQIEEPRVASPRGWRWQGPGVSGRAALWDPFTIELDFSGLHRLTETRSEAAAPVEAEGERATAVVHLQSSGRIDRAKAEVAGLTIRRSGEVLTAERAAVGLGPLRPAAGGRPQELTLTGEAGGITLPEDGAGPLGPALQRLAFAAALQGEIPPGERRRMLEQWRDAGGSLEIGRLDLEWGPLALEGEGAIGLDRRLRPEGEIAARMSGLPGTLDRLVAAGLLKADRARLVKIALRVLADGTDGEGRPVVALPITLQGGRLYLGPAPVLRLSPVL
ncbi:MAG: DUF2125 domain-containing protein [Rhodospirillales bacterium]|nr:DUF2125 domain-containing protein [Rhodospirillales bacterium]MDH3910054.1 DUF2125 domain-containing protein [Rhodospirillales bacterium]MDH3967535.1 DUF2125 domain-containing protein [Rhodospirillales bacterium]